MADAGRSGPIRLGLIGCGYFGQNHMSAWSEIEGVTLVAVCDYNRQRARDAARRVGAMPYDSAETMLRDEALDAVDIVTTVESHRPLVELVARHGAAVICQKPFADSLADGEAMVGACAAAGVRLMVHENFRWQRPIRTLGRMIADGAVGVPQHARIEFRHRHDVYADQPYLARVKRLAIADVGLHLFDVARYLLGEVVSVHCRMQRLNPRVRGEDAFDASLRHAGGAVSLCTSSFFARREPDPFPQTVISVEGSEGTLDLGQGFHLVHHGPDGRQQIDVTPPVPPWGTPGVHVIQDSVRAIQRHWVERFRVDREAETSGADNLHTLAVAEAAYASAAGDRVVRLRRRP